MSACGVKADIGSSMLTASIDEDTPACSRFAVMPASVPAMTDATYPPQIQIAAVFAVESLVRRGCHGLANHSVLEPDDAFGGRNRAGYSRLA